MTRRRVFVAAATTAALVIGVPTAASAHTWWGGRGHHHAPPKASPSAPSTPTTTPTPSDTATPSEDPTPSASATATGQPIAPTVTTTPQPSATATPETDASTDTGAADAPDASFVETFDTDAATGQVAAAYPQSWQPYPDGTSGIYAPSKTVSVHDGVMDVTLGNGSGTAGTFGSVAGAWGHVGGSFSVRAKATGGDGNGAAFMLWPTSGTWSDGEIDFPEGNFEDVPSAFQHSMVPGQEADRAQVGTGVSWRDWHTYTVDWVPGKSVTYSVDGTVLETLTKDVPTTPHRYMFQVGNWGASGHLLIDWVATTE
ncbi:glycoside hydrolase family 16 protein [Curtobacterium sp. ZW137]|uniref:glycoside hydrolase family 16 protein n=1 Tax=Curtobacterium sp. ZW137 TaxID=2485104 RepID=UPI000FB3C3CD|nr:glycoside hydrolase family 16 protein [Curtobacterium sp. ZW137]ROP66023.1 glycosyl hydrolase family 16 [Curtobacterium sp. ZW137]